MSVSGELGLNGEWWKLHMLGLTRLELYELKQNTGTCWIATVVYDMRQQLLV